MARPLYVCAECGMHMRCRKNEVYVIEMATFGPAAIWYADLWECEACKREIVTGFGQRQIVEHYEDKFAQWLEKAKASIFCYYCEWQ